MLSPIFLSLCSVLVPGSQDAQGTTPQAVLEAEVVERKRQRVTYFGGDRNRPSPAQVSLEYGELAFGAEGKSPGWSMGKDYWSTLDTNADLTIAGKKISSGHYYFGVEQGSGKTQLVLLESKKAMGDMLPYVQAGSLEGGVALPLAEEAIEGKARDLSMSLSLVDKAKKPEALLLKLAWGNHEYVAPVEVRKLAQATPFVQLERRMRSILRQKGGKPDAPSAVVSVEHSLPEWKPEREKLMDKIKAGSRWRFGKNFWTSLETNVSFTIAGEKVPPGHYYLVLEKGEKDAWSLVALESAKIRKTTMDAFQTMGTKGGIKAPLNTMPALEEQQSELSVRLLPKKGNQAVLDIRWGPYHLTAPLELALPKR